MKALSRDTHLLSSFLLRHRRVVVLTGAGVSAGSGIPTYRDEEGRWLAAEPVRHQEFVADAGRRQRYWLRSLRGWPAVRDARPNPAHNALARLERSGRIQLLITQNVDRLHQRAGSRRVVDLHGRLDRVRCLACDRLTEREAVQHQLMRGAPDARRDPVSPLPDGDAELPDDPAMALNVPDCTHCGGILMPDVVFFGGTVPRSRVEACMAAIGEADALLAVGSSLQVYSGYRFCRQAARLGKPVALLNPGKTRADDLAELKLGSDCGALLSRVAESLAPARHH